MMTAQIPEIVQLQERALAEAAAFERMGQIARRNAWVNTGFMVAWILAALASSTMFWSVWFLVLAGVNGLAAAVWEEVNPRTWARREAREQRHRDLVRHELLSRFVIARMRQAEIDRANPWGRWTMTSSTFIGSVFALVGARAAAAKPEAIARRLGFDEAPPLGSLAGFTIKNG